MPDSITQDLSSAYAQLAELQTKLDEDDYIIDLLRGYKCDDDNHGTHCNDRHGERCDAALQKVAVRCKELDRELRMVKNRILEIEEKGVRWRG